MMAKRETPKIRTARHVLMLLENEDYPRDNRVYKEATALAERGSYEVSVICPAAPGQRSYAVLEGVHIYRYPAAPPINNKVVSYLVEYGYAMVVMFLISLVIVLRKGFDIIHAHNPPDTLVLIAAFYKLFGKQFVYDQHDLSTDLYLVRFGTDANQSLYRVLVGLERLSYQCADLVIATNESYKAIAIERGAIAQERVAVVRNGPDVGHLPPIEEQLVLRQRTRTVIGYVGVIGFQDGVDYLIRSLAHLAYDMKRTDWFCIIIGDGAAGESVRALAAQLNLTQYIWFTGWISDAGIRRYLLSITDMCAAPEASNPFNDRSTMIKVIEYMAMAKPVVAFDLPEHRRTAQGAALYAQPNEESDFASKIATLMDDPEQRVKMGRLGRERLESELDWPYQLHKLREAYRRLDGL